MTHTENNRVRRGHLTYSGEGNNRRNSRYYSRVIHYPAMGISGVTLGRGYDMGSRTQRQIFNYLTAAGIDRAQADLISRAAGLRGRRAEDFIRVHRQTIGEITEDQQASLFNRIYPDYERRAQEIYNTRTASINNRTTWTALNPAIREVLVDIIYQGYRGETAMPAAADNNIDDFINYIRRTPALIANEPARNRIRFLEANKKE